VPFVFSSLRTVSAGQRIFIGLMIGFGFYILSQVSSQMGQVYGLHPLLTSLLPSALFAFFGMRAIQRL
jgi:lipopolysaccharide export system permease protein